MADKVNPPPEGGWESLKVDELKAELEARGLPKSGTKAELVERLLDDDVSQVGSAPAPEAEEAALEEAAAEEAAPEAEAEAEAEDEDEDEAEAEEGEVEEGEAEDAPVAEEKPRRRRGSAETSTGGRRRQRAPRPEGDLVVGARAPYRRRPPRHARLGLDHHRGPRRAQAPARLTHAPRAVSSDILKLLNSAVANAESAYELGPDELTVRRAYVDEGPTIKRFRPRALGRATRISKRTSHMTIELTTEGNGR